MAADAKERRPSTNAPAASSVSDPASTAKPTPVAKASPTTPTVPFLLDFFPLEGPDQTRLSKFFDRLREGQLSTTRCTGCGEVHWPPRVACPRCHSEALEWVDLPASGRIYAFSAVLIGAPLGMESEVPFAVGLVDLDGSALRLFGRIEGRPWGELRIGGSVRVEAYSRPDGRSFYRFRAVD
ncbi:MAG: Zn-ribbon domain-containing OB-fold protein [Thermoplasmata archaeon]